MSRFFLLFFLALAACCCAQADEYDDSFDTDACNACVARGCTYCLFFVDSTTDGSSFLNACQASSADESGQCTERTDCGNLLWGSESLNSENDCFYETEDSAAAMAIGIVITILICLCCCCGIGGCIWCCVNQSKRNRLNAAGGPTQQQMNMTASGIPAATSNAYNTSNPPPPLVFGSATTNSNVPYASEAVVVVEPQHVLQSSPSPPSFNPNYHSERESTPSDAMMKDLQRSY